MKKLIKLTSWLPWYWEAGSLFPHRSWARYQSRRESLPLCRNYKEMNDQHGGVQQRSARQPGNDSVELNTKYNDFQKNKATYSEVTRQLKEKELTDLQNRLQEFYQSAQEDLQKKEKELTDPIVAKAQEAVKKVAQKELTSPYSIRPSPRWSITTRQP